MSDLFNNVKVGDTVHYSTPQGQYGKGKVVIKHESGSHVVINRGKGQPQVVNDKNYVKHERGGKVIGALLSKLAAHDKYMKSIKEGNEVWHGDDGDEDQKITPKRQTPKTRAAAAKAEKARLAGNKLSPYKLGEPQDNASKAFGWTKTNEARTEGPYGGHPYDWDVEMRKQIFAAAAKKVKQKGPPDNHRDYKPNKLGPPPRRGTTSEDAADAEGQAARVAKTKHKKKTKLHELTNDTLTSYVSKAIRSRHKAVVNRKNADLVYDPDRLGGADGERADYEYNKADAKVKKRSKGIKMAVGKIASKLPGEKVTEGTRSEYDANIKMSQGAGKTAKGHYLMRDGRRLSGPHSPEDAVKQYKGMSDSKGVKIVHVKEGVEIDVTTLMLSEDKVKQAAQKAISLAKKAKGNKHVDTEPKLDIVDKGTHGPIQANDEGGHNA